MKATAECAHPDGCSRTAIVRGWCRAHYFRWSTTGDLGPATFAIREPGRTCAVDDCDRKQSTRGWCSMHYKRWKKHGDPTKLGDRGPGVTGEANAAWAGHDLSYHGIHARLRRHRGPASEYSCKDCGDPASAWAYDHADPNEKTDDSTGYVLPYSGDMAHYIPLCAPCHKRFDMAHTRKAAA